MRNFLFLVCFLLPSFGFDAFAQAQNRIQVDTIQSSWHESAADAREEALQIWRDRYFGVTQYGGVVGHFEGVEGGSIEQVVQESTGKFLKKTGRIIFSSVTLLLSLGMLELDREAQNGASIRTDATYYRMSMPIYFVAN